MAYWLIGLLAYWLIGLLAYWLIGLLAYWLMLMRPKNKKTDKKGK